MPEHRFTVTVSGCSQEQAGQVMAERLDHEEDLGFAYTIGFAPLDRTPAAAFVDMLVGWSADEVEVTVHLANGLRITNDRWLLGFDRLLTVEDSGGGVLLLDPAAIVLAYPGKTEDLDSSLDRF